MPEKEIMPPYVYFARAASEKLLNSFVNAVSKMPASRRNRKERK
jgi:hypothetical protein